MTSYIVMTPFWSIRGTSSHITAIVVEDFAIAFTFSGELAETGEGENHVTRVNELLPTFLTHRDSPIVHAHTGWPMLRRLLVNGIKDEISLKNQQLKIYN